MSSPGPLVDSFGRVHTDLRVSVTDRCNLRCFYCMPEQGVPFFREHREILTFEEVRRFVRVAASLGIHDVRLTGGEPLVRRDVVELVRMLANVPGVRELAMTTNAVLLDKYAAALKDAGLDRLNISLDTLDEATFRRLSRRGDLAQVLAGIEAACQAGFRQIKLNAIALRGVTEKEAVRLTHFALERGLQLRFIEYMPLDGDGQWEPKDVLSGEEILQILSQQIAPLEPASPPASRAPATRYRFTDGRGTIGIVRSVSQPFCSQCSRLRLTADGKVRNCLFATEEWDARSALRGGATDEQLAELLRQAVAAKRQAHGTDDGQFASSQRTMHQIGG